MIDTPFTQALVGWSGESRPGSRTSSSRPRTTFAVLAATSIGPEPIAEAKRLLVTAIARVEPTGFRWVDRWKTAVADPGRPPFLQEPVRRQDRLAAQGDDSGLRRRQRRRTRRPGSPSRQLPGGEGVALVIDGRTAGFHWELVVE